MLDFLIIGAKKRYGNKPSFLGPSAVLMAAVGSVSRQKSPFLYLSGQLRPARAVSQDGAGYRIGDKVSHRVPLKKASVPLRVGQLKPSNGKAYRRFFP